MGEIKKGKTYICIEDWHKLGSSFTKGKIYKCHKDGCMYDDFGAEKASVESLFKSLKECKQEVDVYKKLALTDEQQSILKEFQAAYEKMCSAHIGLVNTFCNGIYAFNGEEVNCFNPPKNAAYDTDKHEIDVAKLQLAFNHSFKNVHELGLFESCLVVFDED